MKVYYTSSANHTSGVTIKPNQKETAGQVICLSVSIKPGSTDLYTALVYCSYFVSVVNIIT